MPCLADYTHLQWSTLLLSVWQETFIGIIFLKSTTVFDYNQMLMYLWHVNNWIRIVPGFWNSGHVGPSVFLSTTSVSLSPFQTLTAPNLQSCYSIPFFLCPPKNFKDCNEGFKIFFFCLIITDMTISASFVARLAIICKFLWGLQGLT